MLPLKGLKVVDLSKVLAGPLCGQYLGELGADVIKVEPVGKGDDTRGWLPQANGESAVFMAVNRNKRSIAIDLKTKSGQGIVYDLIRNADIVLQGFRGKTAEKLGVDYESLIKINPNLIYCEISGYGRDGPLGNAPGYDVMLQAFSGMISTMGESDGHFARASFSPVDIGTGMNAFSGVLAAIIERSKTGKGVYFEATLLDTALGFMSYMAQSFWMTGDDPKPMGTGHPSMCPYQAFEATDGVMMLGAGNDAQWKKFCEVAGLQDYVNHPDFCTNAMRMKNMQKTVAIVSERFKTKTIEEWLTALRAVGVPCSPIHKLSQALSHPQVLARGIIAESKHPQVGNLQQICLPIKFQNQVRQTNKPPPLLGEHTAEILRDLGYKDDQIESLRHNTVIA